MKHGIPLAHVWMVLLCITMSCYGQPRQIPRFVGEMRLMCDNLSVSQTGSGATFSAAFQNWDKAISYSLKTSQVVTSTGTMSVNLSSNIDASNHDHLLIAFEPFWSGQKVTLNVTTELGNVSAYVDVTSHNIMHWLSVNLNGAQTIQDVSIEIQATQVGEYAGHIKHVILRNTTAYDAFINYWLSYAQVDWDKFLQPLSYTPQFKVKQGILYSDTDIDALRLYLAANPNVESDFLGGPLYDMTRDHSEHVYPVIPYIIRESYMDTWGYYLHASGEGMAFAGLVSEDADMMRAAAKCALYLAAYDNWEDACLPDNTVGQWYDTAFRPGFYADAVARMLDYAGEMLTSDGYNYILKQLYKKGVCQISYSLMARPVYDINQYAYFNNGRVASLLVMEKTWPEADVLTDDAVSKLQINMDNLFRADGSFTESTGYLEVVTPNAMNTYAMYAKVRGQNVIDIVPQNLKNSADEYAQLLLSTNADPKRGVLAIGESSAWVLSPPTGAYMATLDPSGAWGVIYDKNPLPAEDLQYWYLRNALQQAPPANPVLDHFIFLSDTGLASSLRYDNDLPVKMVVLGNQDRGKINDDIGSFILEYAGDTFAIGMPNVRWGIYQNSLYHNRLNPTLSSTLPDMTNANITMTASGDSQECHFSLNLTPTLVSSQMTSWTRAIDSTSPTRFTITDTYQTGIDANGVDFTWISYLPVSINGNTATLTGNYGGVCTITAPSGCTLSTETFTREDGGAAGMNFPDEHLFTRLLIHKPDSSGTLVVQVDLFMGGSITEEIWNNVSTSSLAELAVDPDFPSNPDSIAQVSGGLDRLVSIGDNYGRRMRGYLHVPATGNYTFYIAGDDNCEFWLSTDNTVANASRIAYSPTWCPTLYNWTRFATQTSQTIQLTAGQAYYFEVLQKDGGGDDHVEVAWDGPNLSGPVGIAASYLSPWDGGPVGAFGQ